MHPYQETASQGKLAEKYYSGGKIIRPAAPAIHESSTLAPFRAIKSQRVRQAQGGTTEAMEITFKIEGPKAQHIADQLQAGLFFAFEPKNDKETVDAILGALKPSAQEQDGRITVPVTSAYMMTIDQQTLPKRDVLAGLIDVSRPTGQLVNLLALRAKEAGNPLPEPHDAAELAACYSVAELLQHRPGLLTLEDVYANQPAMMARPYTISDFDRDNRTVSVLISGVSAKLAASDPLGIKGEVKERTKDGGNASGMLLDIASAGKDGGPDSDFLLNGYVLTRMPHLMFPGIVDKTEAVRSFMDSSERVAQHVKAFEEAQSPDQTLYFMATGSGMAPFMAALREMSRRQQADPQHKKPFAGNIVLINGGRHAEDELFADECRQFVKDGLVDAYHAAASSTGKEKYVTLKDGELNEREVQGKVAGGGRYYIQDVLEAAYGRTMDADIRAGKAKVYVCGTQGALQGVFQKWPEAFRNSRNALQHTASIPGRYFEHMWERRNDVTSHREPVPVENRAENPGAWTRRHLKIAEVREGDAARSFAR